MKKCSRGDIGQLAENEQFFGSSRVAVVVMDNKIVIVIADIV